MKLLNWIVCPVKHFLYKYKHVFFYLLWKRETALTQLKQLSNAVLQVIVTNSQREVEEGWKFTLEYLLIHSLWIHSKNLKCRLFLWVALGCQVSSGQMIFDPTLFIDHLLLPGFKELTKGVDSTHSKPHSLCHPVHSFFLPSSRSLSLLLALPLLGDAKASL